MIAMLGGETTLTPTVITTIATPLIETSLVLTELLGETSIPIHVGRLGITPPRTTLACQANGRIIHSTIYVYSFTRSSSSLPDRVK